MKALKTLAGALLLATALLPLFASEPPAQTGPEGLLLWEKPRDVAQIEFKMNTARHSLWRIFPENTFC